MVDPMNLDRISYYLAYHGVDFEVLIDDVQSAIDNEETGEWSQAKNNKLCLCQLHNLIILDTKVPVARNKRQNSLFDLLPFFTSQSRPRRKPQLTGTLLKIESFQIV